MEAKYKTDFSRKTFSPHQVSQSSTPVLARIAPHHGIIS